jgi:hypothetical protein
VGSCEHGNEMSGSIEGCELPGQLGDGQLLKDESIPCSYMVSTCGNIYQTHISAHVKT